MEHPKIPIPQQKLAPTEVKGQGSQDIVCLSEAVTTVDFGGLEVELGNRFLKIFPPFSSGFSTRFAEQNPGSGRTSSSNFRRLASASWSSWDGRCLSSQLGCLNKNYQLPMILSAVPISFCDTSMLLLGVVAF